MAAINDPADALKQMMGDDPQGSLNNLMQQAQQMQEKMQSAQEELAAFSVTGQSGAGMVKIDMNGRHDVLRVVFDKNIMEEDKEVIEDLVAAAVNDAVRKIEKEARKKMTELTSGLGLPGGEGGAAGGAAGGLLGGGTGA